MESPKSKSTALIIALFIGGFGVHRFYLNQPVLGILYLLFSWTFIPLVISIIDIFAFIFMSEKTFNRKYNSHVEEKVKDAPSNEPNHKDKNEESDEVKKIEKLHNLMEKGIISEEEFQKKKEELLSSI